MPMYEFKCEECQHQFIELLKISDRVTPLNSSCPNCKKEKCITSILSAPAIVSPFSIDGLRKPRSDFKDRMSQIKTGQYGTSKIKDY